MAQLKDTIITGGLRVTDTIISDAISVTENETIANGDRIAIVDSSEDSKLTGSSVTFDGSTTSKALSQKGTWESFSADGHTHAYSEITGTPTLGTLSAIDDAPSNGNEYVRKNGAWAVSSGGGGEVTPVWGDITGTIGDQTDLQTALDDKADVIISSASGAVASFSDGGDGMPVTALTVGIEPVQDLHGYDNPWPAGGGKNLCSMEDQTFTAYKQVEITPIPAGTYVYSGIVTSNDTDSNYCYISFRDEDENEWASKAFTRSTGTTRATSGSFTVSAPIKYIRLYAGANSAQSSGDTATYKDNMIEPGSTATSFAPYSNVCPISGWTQAKVTRTGKNLWNSTNALTATIYASNNKIMTYEGWKVIYAPCKPNTTYTLSKVLSERFVVAYTKELPANNVQVYNKVTANENTLVTYTTGADANYIVAIVYSTSDTKTYEEIAATIQIELGETASTYQPYSGTSVTIDLDGTVYGGTLDVLTGTLTVDRAIHTFDGTDTYKSSGWRRSETSFGFYFPWTLTQNATSRAANIDAFIISDKLPTQTYSDLYDMNVDWGVSVYNTTTNDIGIVMRIGVPSITSASDLSAWLDDNPITVVYQLAEPLTYTLTPQQLTLLKKENNIFADCGNISLEYRADTKSYVDEIVSESQTGHSIYYVKGTQTATTGAWTGDLPEVSELYEGLTINYWLPFSGSGNATLELTLKDGVSSGAVNCYFTGTSRVTTQSPANSFILFTYHTVTINGTQYTGWWRQNDNNTTNILSLYEANGNYIADSKICRNQLLLQIDEDTLTPLNNANSTGTTKTMLTDVAFNPYGRIYYYNTTTEVSAGAAISAGSLYFHCNFDLRYTFNCGQTLTAHKYIYLKVILQTNGMVKIATGQCWAQDLPTTNDGYLYILLGRVYSTYQMMLYIDHPVYYHDGTSIRKYLGGIIALDSPKLTGTPTSVTLDFDDNSNAIATNAYVWSHDCIAIWGTVSQGTTATFTDSKIASDNWYVQQLLFDTPSSVTSDVTWTTNATNHTITLTGTFTAATNVVIILQLAQS